MESGWYIDKSETKPRKFWVIGTLPCGRILTLQTKTDGTSYTQTLPESDAKCLEGVKT